MAQAPKIFGMNVSVIGAWGSVLAIPTSILLWYLNTPPVPATTQTKQMSSQGANSPVIDAGGDVVIGGPTGPGSAAPPKLPAEEPADAAAAETPDVSDTKASSTGDNSPVVIAKRDVVINQPAAPAPPKPDYITDHDGAGALLMEEPDFMKFLSGTIQGETDAVLGRLINGTALALLEMTEAEEKLLPPWKKVRVLEGKLKDKTGWILADSIRKP